METFAVESLDTKYTLNPTSDKIAVRRSAKKETPSGLVLPENMKGKDVVEGEVVATGPGAIVQGDPTLRHKMQVHIGDKVLFNKHSGTEIEVNGEKLTVMHENEILVSLAPAKAGAKS
jgi:chaperonin GroES